MLRRALKELELRGLLLLADAWLPSVVSVIVGRPVSGSWWSAPEGKLIYNTANDLERHPDALIVKLLSGKLTFVHRRLWPAIYAIGIARESWQMQSLSEEAKWLLRKLDKNGEVYTDALVAVGGVSFKAVGTAAKELEKGLLAVIHGFRLEGKHHRHLQSWPDWAVKAGMFEKKMASSEGKKQLSGATQRLNTEFGAKAKTPWPRNKKQNSS
ncbi:MAG: AlkZ-related protein [Anaerolineales bacterium]